MRTLAILAFATLVCASQTAAQAGREPRTGGRQVAPEIRSISYGRWVVDREGEWVEAWTDNESGSEFGLLCSSDCLIYLDFQIACEEGGDYPAIVNGGAGALPIAMSCRHYQDRHIFITEATGEYIDMLQRGEELGFAFPLDGGQFRVARFSTRGGFEAMIAAVKMAMKSGKLKQAPKDVSI